MHRLRALLSASRLARGAGAMPPVGAGVRADEVGRRRLLGLIAAAPMALPAAVRAVASAEPLSSRVVGYGLLDDWPMVVGDWTSATGAVDFDLAALSSRIVTPGVIEAEMAHAFSSYRSPRSVAGEDFPLPIAAAPTREGAGRSAPVCAPLIDDVGSGP